MATETDLAIQVMRELTVLPSGETPSDEERDDVLTRYYQRRVMLEDEDYADWPQGSNITDDVIPAAAMPGLVKVMAYECAPMFGGAELQRTLVDQTGKTWDDLGLIALRRYMRNKPSYEPVRAEYF